MTQTESVHVFGKTGCGSLLAILGIASVFSQFDVSETGTGMPCYCIQWNVSDKANDAFFQSELEEERSSHDLATATATHRIHSSFFQHGKLIQEEYNPIDLLIAGENITHPFGQRFEDTVAFYMSDFVDPPNNLHRIISFFWYTFVQGGSRATLVGGIKHPAQVVASSKSILIPHWFTPTDITMEFVGIEGHVDFSKELDATIELGRTVDTTTGLEIAAIQGNNSPCVTTLGYESSNACLTIKETKQFRTTAKMSVMTVTPPPPPPPPPTANVASVKLNPAIHGPDGNTYLQAIVTMSGASGTNVPVTWYVDDGKVTTTTTGPGDLPTLGVAYLGFKPAVGQHTAYAVAGQTKSNIITFTV